LSTFHEQEISGLFVDLYLNKLQKTINLQDKDIFIGLKIQSAISKHHVNLVNLLSKRAY